MSVIQQIISIEPATQQEFFSENNTTAILFARHERQGNLFLRTREASVVFALCHSEFSIRGESAHRGFTNIDAYNFLVLPPSSEIELTAVSSPADICVISYSGNFPKATGATYNISEKEITAVLSRKQILQRTNWVNELVHRYLYERKESIKQNAKALDFLEEEILKEVFVTYRDRDVLKLKNRFNLNQHNIDGKSPVLRKALYIIERNLFEEMSVQDVSDKINASVSTLLRVFKNELYTSPLAYIQERRLEEARSMLKTGQFSILDVALITGYSSISSFSKAFKRRYKTTPSEFIRTFGENCKN